MGIMRKPSLLMKTLSSALLSQCCAYAASLLSLCLIIPLICVCFSTISHSKEHDHITLMWRHIDHLLPHSCAIFKNSCLLFIYKFSIQNTTLHANVALQHLRKKKYMTKITMIFDMFYVVIYKYKVNILCCMRLGVLHPALRSQT